MKVGLVIVDEDPRDVVTVARAADAAGIHSLWTIDYYNGSSLARAAMMAAVTDRVIIGTSVTPLFARSGLALAVAALDVQALSGGRFVLGLGSSTRRMNSDWYGTELAHPAPQAEDRLELLRKLLGHTSGSFEYEGRFDKINLGHLERQVAPDPIPILVAGVGPMMVRLAARRADGFVGHTVASADNLREIALPIVDREVAAQGRPRERFLVTSQIIASVDDTDGSAARRRAALHTAFYSTPKGYDALFPDPRDEAARQDAREAFGRRDLGALGAAGDRLVEDRAVFGGVADVAGQLKRYDDVVDWAMLYPPNYGLTAREIFENEMQLIEVAKCWAS